MKRNINTSNQIEQYYKRYQVYEIKMSFFCVLVVALHISFGIFSLCRHLFIIYLFCDMCLIYMFSSYNSFFERVIMFRQVFVHIDRDLKLHGLSTFVFGK